MAVEIEGNRAVVWRPVSQREEDDDALFEGVPPWLVGSLVGFLRPSYRWTSGGVTRYDVALMRETERMSRISLGYSDHPPTLYSNLCSALAQNPTALLDAVDFMVHRSGQIAGQVNAALEQGGSAWRVAESPDGFSLQRRVDQTVAASAQDVIQSSGRAGQHLATAWSRIYGREPSPSDGYREAVRAVEAAAIPVILPTNPRATLGQIIPAIRDAPHKWRITLSPADGSDPMNALTDMLQLLWKSQLDRHGTPDESVPISVSLDEARAAVHLATTLVQWFTSGAVLALP